MSTQDILLNKTTLAKLNERAKNAQKLRKKAPRAGISVGIRSPMKELERRVCKRYMDEGIDPNTIHTIPIPIKRVAEFSERGYVVELDGMSQPYENEGHVMMTCPQEQFKQSRHDVSARSAMKQRAEEQKVKEMAEATGSTVEFKSGHVNTDGSGANAVSDDDDD